MRDDKRDFLKFMIETEKTKITNFLTTNPKIMASALVEEMISVGLPVGYISLVTGVSIEEDDLIKNIESLKQTCLKLHVDFYGFHYKAAFLIPLPAIDDDLEKLCFEILEKEFTCLSHKELQDKNYSARLTV